MIVADFEDFEDFCADCLAVNFMFGINNQNNDNNNQIRFSELVQT